MHCQDREPDPRAGFGLSFFMDAVHLRVDSREKQEVDYCNICSVYHNSQKVE